MREEKRLERRFVLRIVKLSYLRHHPTVDAYELVVEQGSSLDGPIYVDADRPRMEPLRRVFTFKERRPTKEEREACEKAAYAEFESAVAVARSMLDAHAAEPR